MEKCLVLRGMKMEYRLVSRRGVNTQAGKLPSSRSVARRVPLSQPGRPVYGVTSSIVWVTTAALLGPIRFLARSGVRNTRAGPAATATKDSGPRRQAQSRRLSFTEKSLITADSYQTQSS